MLSKKTDAVKFVMLAGKKPKVVRVCHRAAFIFSPGPRLLREQAAEMQEFAFDVPPCANVLAGREEEKSTGAVSE